MLSGIAYGTYGTHSFYNRNNWHGLLPSLGRHLWRRWLRVVPKSSSPVSVNTTPQPWQRWAKRVAKRREATPLKAWNARQLARVARLGGAQ